MNRGAVRILVLGDSTLSSLGGQFRNAVDVLLDASYAAPVEIMNVSVAGLTSADAELHFAELARSERFDAVVVYVGNCDACGYGSPRVFAPLGLARLMTRLRARRGHARRAEPFRLGEPCSQPHRW